MKLLGVITEVTERGMQISLPNGLKGTVTRAEASEPFAGKGANRRGGDGDDDEISASDASSSDSDSDSDDDADPLSLTEAFEIGQVIRCVVRRLDKGKSGGKRIDLATRLDAVCVPGRASDPTLREGVNVPATVESVEDHGFVLSFGGGADGPRGFLPRKSAGKRALVRGSVLDVVLTGEKKDAGAVGKSRVLHATADPKRVASVVTHESDGTVMSTLLPGMLVNARVRSVLSDGVSVNFMTYFVATADAFHVGDAKGSGAIPDAAARIRTTRTSRASDAARACCTSTPRPNASDSPFDLDFCVSVSATLGGRRRDDAPGAVYEDAIVRRVDPAVGVLLELPGNATSRASVGYCHISDAADDRVDKLERRFRVGKTVRARVVGRRALDGVAVVSCRPSTLDQPFLSLDELAPGMDVRGEVVAVEPYGAVVKLAPGVKALCPPHHVSDVPGRVTSSKVREGAVLKFRVLSVDLARRRAAVTHKKALVKSELAVVASLADAAPGATSHGVVTGVEPYGVFVQLWGNVRGLAGLQNLGLAADQTPRRGVRAGTGGSRDGHSRGRRRGEGATEPRRRRRVVFKRRRRRGGRGRIRGRRRGARAGDDDRIRRRETRGRIHRERSRDASGGRARRDCPGADVRPPGVGRRARRRASKGGRRRTARRARGETAAIRVESQGDARGRGARGTTTSAARRRRRRRRGRVPRVRRVGDGERGRLRSPSSRDSRVGAAFATHGRPRRGRDGPRGGVCARTDGVGAGHLRRRHRPPPRMSLSLAPRAARASKNDNTLNDAALVRAVFADVDDADALHDARDEGGDESEEDEDSSAYLRRRRRRNWRDGVAKIAATVRASREYGVLVDMPDVDPDAVGLVAFHQLPGGAADGPGDAPEEGTVLRGVVARREPPRGRRRRRRETGIKPCGAPAQDQIEEEIHHRREIRRIPPSRSARRWRRSWSSSSRVRGGDPPGTRRRRGVTPPHGARSTTDSPTTIGPKSIGRRRDDARCARRRRQRRLRSPADDSSSPARRGRGGRDGRVERRVLGGVGG